MKEFGQLHRHHGCSPWTALAQMARKCPLERLTAVVDLSNPPGRLGKALEIAASELHLHVRSLKVLKPLRPGMPRQGLTAGLDEILSASRFGQSGGRLLSKLNQITCDIRDLLIPPIWVLLQAALEDGTTSTE